MYTFQWQKGNLNLLESLERLLESNAILNVTRERDFSSPLTSGALVHREDIKCTSGKMKIQLAKILSGRCILSVTKSHCGL